MSRASHLDMTDRNPTSSIRWSFDKPETPVTNAYASDHNDGWQRPASEYPVASINYADMDEGALLRVLEDATAELRKRAYQRGVRVSS